MTDEQNLTDAKIAASEAKTDTKFAELRGEMKLMGAKLDKVLSKVDGFESRLAEQRSDIKADFRANRILMIGLAVSVSGLMLAVVLAVFTIGNTMFSRGISVRDVVKAVVAEQQSQPSKPTTP